MKFADYEGYTNQNKHQMLVEQIQNGKFVTVWPKELAERQAALAVPRLEVGSVTRRSPARRSGAVVEKWTATSGGRR